MVVWVARAVAAFWAGFWLWFGAASAIAGHQPWLQVLYWACRPGAIFAALAAAAWRWPRVGGALLVLTSIVVAGWYAVWFGHMPLATKALTLATFALPPLISGILFLAHKRAAS
jgi:hypothetical protein